MNRVRREALRQLTDGPKGANTTGLVEPRHQHDRRVNRRYELGVKIIPQ